MHNINLNLLKALNALLLEQNVSKAGERVGVSQSAMSLTLAQLRTIFKDDLLVRGAQGKMQLTAFAHSLITPVNNAIRQAELVFTAHLPFDPASSTRIFHIGMSDYIAFVLLPKLMREITNQAPGVRIIQHAINHMDNLTPFDEGKLDVVIGDFQSVPRSLKVTQLFTDKGVIVADKHHPAIKNGKLTLKEFIQYPQVFVSLESQPEQNFIADMLKKMGHDIKISLITPHTLIALQALPGTNLMTNTVEKLAKPFIQSLGLAMCEPPYKLRKFSAKMYWHARDHNDQAHVWLRSLIKKCIT